MGGGGGVGGGEKKKYRIMKGTAMGADLLGHLTESSSFFSFLSFLLCVVVVVVVGRVGGLFLLHCPKLSFGLQCFLNDRPP